MTKRFKEDLPTALEEQAYTEADQLFAEYLQLFPASRAAVERLDRRIAKLAPAANTTASLSIENVIQSDDGVL